jgi:hypothetical protein
LPQNSLKGYTIWGLEANVMGSVDVI